MQEQLTLTVNENNDPFKSKYKSSLVLQQVKIFYLFNNKIKIIQILYDWSR